jgi:transcriptional regulator with XRE-family HTH domain
MSHIEERNMSLESCKMIELQREQKGLSRAELAKDVKVSYSYIFNIETGRKRCVSYGILKKIADTLEIDLYKLLGEQTVSDSTYQEKSFEEILFSNKLNIAGREINYHQKAEIYDLLKMYTNSDLTVPKKLEYIISKLYNSKLSSQIN